MIDHVVVDVEIQKPIEQCSDGWNSTDEMGVACAVVYEFQGARFRVYGPDDIEDLRQRLSIADKISGFNIWKFDYQVIWGLKGNQRIPELRSKTNDLLVNIWRNLGLDTNNFTGAHKGWSLDNVCKATLGRGKIGNGAEAPHWYQDGQIHRVINYCLDDVALERDLTIHMDEQKFVLHPTKDRLDLVLPEWNP
jgi:hypothetical protein